MQSTRRKILNSLTASLEPIYGSREALSIARLALEELMGWTQRDFLLDADAPLTLTDEQTKSLDDLQEDLIQAKPAQYIFNKAEFYGLDFFVAPGCLIPRPETELLVEWIKKENKTGRVLDIGTGSGAISIALAYQSDFELTAIDISEEALKIALRNAEKHNLTIEFQRVDILNPEASFVEQEFDIIVSNPPYIPDSEAQDMHANVINYEPHLALFVPDNDPLLFYRKIAQIGLTTLNNKGLLYFEIHENFAEQTAEMLKGLGYENIEIRKDINDKDRMIRCQKKA